jgi:transglutaminase-like putative cysteine protease
MRLKIRHETIYSYDAPAMTAIQILRMTPRSHDGQFVQRWRVEIDADCRLDKNQDCYGNITHVTSVEGPFQTLRVIAEGDVDVTDKHGIIGGTMERFPLGAWLRETDLTRPTPELRAFARQISSSQGANPLATLHSLMTMIHSEIGFVVGSSDATTTAAQAFTNKVGVCQDLAHIFITCARSLGIPARYAGGYYLRTDTTMQDAGHAWAEAHVDGVGWIGFDPANGVCISNRHVRVAIGQDYLDASPMRGSILGGSDEKLSVTVEVKQGREIIDG